MDEQVLEAIAEQIHDAWAAEKQRQGFADHTYQPGGKSDTGERRCLRCYGPEDRHHADMLPYSKLTENVKEYDRVTARAALAGIEQAGYRLVKAG